MVTRANVGDADGHALGRTDAEPNPLTLALSMPLPLPLTDAALLAHADAVPSREADSAALAVPLNVSLSGALPVKQSEVVRATEAHAVGEGVARDVALPANEVLSRVVAEFAAGEALCASEEDTVSDAEGDCERDALTQPEVLPPHALPVRDTDAQGEPLGEFDAWLEPDRRDVIDPERVSSGLGDAETEALALRLGATLDEPLALRD